MNADSLRQALSTIKELLHRLPGTTKVGSPYVEEYGRVVESVAELGIDVDAFRVSPGPGESEIERIHLQQQLAVLGSTVSVLLKRTVKRGRPSSPGRVDPRLN
jgi:hypothetical protein